VKDCEVRRGERWVLITADEAQMTNEREGRCPEPDCHGGARLHRRGKNGAAAHFEHLQWPADCPRRDRSYGKP